MNFTRNPVGMKFWIGYLEISPLKTIIQQIDL